MNICTLTDSYKLGHHQQYPPGTQRVYSYFESRLGAKFPETVFFGLQYIMKRYLAGQVVTREKIEKAARLSAAHFGNDSIFNRDMWEHILAKHDGRLPVRIKAVQEGTPVPVGNVMMTVENTDEDNCWALTNHLETILTHVWYGSAVATLSREVKKMLAKWCDGDVLDFMLHDFGFRGATCIEAAAIGGAAHLLNFKGTDTIAGMELLMDYYHAKEIPGYSVPATEHSVMTAMGCHGEEEIVGRLLETYPTGILSIVADSYNIYNFCENIIGGTFRSQIIQRDGIVVVRPDSGDPVQVMLSCLDILWRKFGGRRNAKGYREIQPKVKLLWGDGLDLDTIEKLCRAITGTGWSMSNVATFGMGGGLLQKVNRDTQRSAFKCSAQLRNGEWVDIFKDPLDASKKSKRGRLALGRDSAGSYYTSRMNTLIGRDHLAEVFVDGQVTREWTLSEMRA